RVVARVWFAIHGGVGGDNPLAHGPISQALEQFSDAQRLRSHAVERRNGSMQDVIESAELLGFFHGEQVRRFLDDADRVFFTFGVAAYGTERAVLVFQVDLTEAEDALAQAHLLAQFADTVAEPQNV